MDELIQPKKRGRPPKAKEVDADGFPTELEKWEADEEIEEVPGAEGSLPVGAIVVPEPPKLAVASGPRDAIWECDNKHRTQSTEDRKPECRLSICDKQESCKVIVVYAEKQRKPRDPRKSA